MLFLSKANNIGILFILQVPIFYINIITTVEFKNLKTLVRLNCLVLTVSGKTERVILLIKIAHLPFLLP